MVGSSKKASSVELSGNALAPRAKKKVRTSLVNCILTCAKSRVRFRLSE